MNDGNNTVKVLEKGKSYRVHHVDEAVIACSKTLHGGKWAGECNICEKYAKAWQDGDEKLAKTLKPFERHEYKVVLNGVETHETFGRTIAQMLDESKGEQITINKGKVVIEPINPNSETREFVKYSRA